jgi:Putative zinc-finger
MKCENVKQRISAFIDLRLEPSDHRDVERHLASCRGCSNSVLQMNQVRRALANSARFRAPEHLTASLRAIAGRERARRLRIIATLNALQHWWDRVSITTGNFMRPLAIPIAGGIFSAVILFSMMAPYFAISRNDTHDIPTVLFTQPTVKSIIPFRDPGGEIILDVQLNEQGRVEDYSILKGQALMGDATLRRAILNNVLFTQFDPPTAFGQPVRGKAIVRFESADHIDVIG